MATSGRLPLDGGQVIWTALNEDWRSEWASWSAQTAGRFTDRVTEPLPNGMRGRYSLKVEIIDGDVAYSQGDPSLEIPNPDDGPWGERAEVAMEQPPRYLPGTFTKDAAFMVDKLFDEGTERWISFQLYLPESYPSELSRVPTDYWQNVLQWKQLLAPGTPVMTLQTNDSKWKFYWDGVGGKLAEVALTKEVWARFTIRFVWSPSASVGMVEIWADPTSSGTMTQLVPPTRGITMMDPSNPSDPTQSHTRLGLYRNPIVTGSTWAAYFGYTVATSRAAAEHQAFYAIDPLTVP